MIFKAEFVVTLLLVVSSLFLTVIGRTICPDDRKCDKKMCGPTQVCHVLFHPCPPPEDLSTDSPYCPPEFVCEDIPCPMEQPPPTELPCIEGYKSKMIKLPHCDFELPSCVEANCGDGND